MLRFLVVSGNEVLRLLVVEYSRYGGPYEGGSHWWTLLERGTKVIAVFLKTAIPGYLFGMLLEILMWMSPCILSLGM